MVVCREATRRPSSVSNKIVLKEKNMVTFREVPHKFLGEYREYQKQEKEAKVAKAKEAKEASGKGELMMMVLQNNKDYNDDDDEKEMDCC